MSNGFESYNNWSVSAGGLPIPLFEKKGTQATHPILFIGGVHGDEPEGVDLAQETLQWIQTIQLKVPWFIVPCLNPDGHQRNERTNANGVDLNRNFPDSNWTQFHTAPRYYPGPSPASEPEVQGLIKLIDRIQPQVIIHCHSWKPCIVLTGDRGHRFAEPLVKSSGYEFKTDIGYPTPGSLGEFGWREKNIPVICIEVEEKLERPQISRLFRNGLEELFQLD